MDRADLTIVRGDDYGATVVVTNAGAPADLTGYTARAQIRPGPAATTAFDFQTDIEGSEIRLLMGKASTELLESRHYVWDLEISDGSGTTTTLIGGNVSITLDVTRT